MLDKKGLLGGGPGGGPRQPISLLLGLAFMALGIIPLLFSFNFIGFNLPAEPGGVILWVLASIGGIILLWDALAEQMPTGIESQLKMASIVGGLVLLAIGVIPILHNFAIIPFNLPDLASIIINILFVIAGFLLLYGGTKQF